MVKTFQCDYTATERVWGDVRLTSEGLDEASIDAKLEIERMYPEYEDVTIEHVEEIVK